jgi:hypothetical protein
MDIPGYLEEIRKLHASGQTTEHSFRPALERLFASIDPALTVINEPRRTVDVGAPESPSSKVVGRYQPVALDVLLHR